MAISFDSIRNFFLGSATGTLDSNFDKISGEFQKILYRDGSSVMTGPLDMNSKRIINIPYPLDGNDAVNLSSVQDIANDISKGPTGPANSTYTTLDSLRGAPVTNASYIFSPINGAEGSTTAGVFLYQKDNAPYTADNINVVKLNDVSLTVGALVRQNSAGVNFDGRSAETKLRETVSVTDGRFAGGAKGNGVSDDTAAFQAVVNAYPNGAVVTVPPGTYSVSRVNITSKNIWFALDSAAILKKRGSAGINSRGIFVIANIDAYFKLTGGVIDLNGEGPLDIGVEGRITNLYGAQTVAEIKGIAGPVNAAIYAVRSSRITVSDTTIKNTGESGLVFRNCSDTLVQNVDFFNCANFGSEVNYPIAANDGGTGPMPALGNHRTIGCTFTDINDYCMGTGNGVGVGGGGDGTLGRIGLHTVESCTFIRCQRDIHYEFGSGSWIEPMQISGIRSRDAGQGTFGGIGVRNVSISDYKAMNPSGAATGALIAMIRGTATPDNWPSLYGLILSADWDRVGLSNIQVVDNRQNPIRAGVTGTVAIGSTAFSASDAAFVATDVGQEIAIAGAGPLSGQVAHICRIASVNSATSVTLSRPVITGVSAAKYAWGGACRRPLEVVNGVGGSVIGCRFEGGISSGLTNEPVASGVHIAGLSGELGLKDNDVVAPTTTGSNPAGIRILPFSGGKLNPRDNRVGGFTQRYIGLDSYRGSVRAIPYSTPNHSAITASSAANTYGSEMFFPPSSDHILQITASQLIFNDKATGEVTTVRLTAYRYDGASNTLDFDNNTAGDSSRTLSPMELWALNQADAPIRNYSVQMKSSIANSVARLFVRTLGIQE